MTERFRDEHTHLHAFSAEFLVRCPRCERCAVVRRDETPLESGPGRRVSLACGACGNAARREMNVARIAGATDWYFGLPLWLQAPCCGETLWAYNAAHLAYLEAYVGARLRAHVRHPEHGWSNASVASRLPAWMSRAKNRDAVLACIARLRETRLPAG